MSLQELTNYIEDDWNDQKTTDRDTPQSGFYKDKGVIYETGDLLKGIYRPEWDVENGNRPTANPNGTLTFQPVDRVITNTAKEPEDFHDLTYVARSTVESLDHAFSVAYSYQDSNNNMRLYGPNWRQFGLLTIWFETVGGNNNALIRIEDPKDTLFHTLRVVQDKDKSGEVFIDSASRGTAIASNNISEISPAGFVVGQAGTSQSDHPVRIDSLFYE